MDALQSQNISYFERNPRKTLFGVIIIILCFFVVLLEFYLRVSLSFNPSYYVTLSDMGKHTSYKYPFGMIYYNKDGFPDKEFNEIKSKPRIAYIGDSVCFGIGAGYGYRISEVLKNEMPQYEHLNLGFGGKEHGNGCDIDKIDKIVSWGKKFKIDKLIYLMNLNDILPTNIEQPTDKLWIIKFKNYFDWLRGNSYLFTYLRYCIKNYYMRQGYEYLGLEAYELYPEKNKSIIQETIERIQLLNNKLRKENIEFIVVILPYEMQISQAAEKKYEDLGAKWSQGFINRGPQKLIEEYLIRYNINYIDAYFAFIDQNNVEGGRGKNGLGEYFVYNKGDRLDWNHPNRVGHKKIADYIYLKLNKL